MTTLPAHESNDLRQGQSDDTLGLWGLTHPPFHRIPNVPNFRSIGGWPIRSPAFPGTSLHVNPAIIYRGSDPLRIDADGIQTLLELNITKDFDLRSKQQTDKLGIRDLGEHGIERIWTPVFSEIDYTDEKAEERYERYASEDPNDTVQAFIEILEAGASMMRCVVDHLLSSAAVGDTIKQPAFFMHCTTGNNRTGVFIAMMLLLLHVPAQYVALEYTLSEYGLAPTRHLNVERLLRKGAFERYGAEEAKKKCERMIGARAENMHALIREVQIKWGGAEGYYKQLVGLSDEEIASVREYMTIKGRGKLVSSLETLGN